MAQQRIRIRLKSFDHKALDRWAQRISQTVVHTGARVRGPIPLPTEIRRFCVPKSPFVDKESMEHFEIRTHKRLIDILDPSQRTIEALSDVDIPGGVDIEMKV
ncbi:MAG TPA: 30S ribosomal protein S10 [Armatimonadetes bacterium]|nr:30S ribosomal protein S10 [Armatimonadota bacterium]